MTLQNKTGICVLYETETAKGELMPNERTALALPADGVLRLRLRLPYGSMSRGMNTGKRWLDRFLSKLCDGEWEFAVTSAYAFGGLSEDSTVDVVRIKEEIDRQSMNTYDCLFATCGEGYLISEYHEVTDGQAAVKATWKLWRKLFLFYFLLCGAEAGVVWLVWLGIINLLSAEPSGVIWLFIFGLLALETLFVYCDIKDVYETPWEVSRSLKNKAITKHFRTDQKRK